MRVPPLGRQRRECLIPDIDSIPKRRDEDFWISTLRVQFSIKPGRAWLPKDKKLLSQAENKQNKTKQHGDMNKQSRQTHIWKGFSSPSSSQKAGSLRPYRCHSRIHLHIPSCANLVPNIIQEKMEWRGRNIFDWKERSLTHSHSTHQHNCDSHSISR